MIKAIETVYKGYRFRSRLEARWAVFFDEMGYDWEYESEGYVLSDGKWYLPDFKINGVGTPFYFEIKPKGIDHDDKGLKMPDCKILCGDPVDNLKEDCITICPGCGAFRNESDLTPRTEGDEMYIYCGNCEVDRSNGRKRTKSLKNHSICFYKGELVMYRPEYKHFIKLTRNAAIKARQARFEHGG